MYVERIHKKCGEKEYEQILLRESYRARKGKVDKRTLLNLTHAPREQVEAIEWALKHPEALRTAMADAPLDLQVDSEADPQESAMREGKSVGAVWAVARVAERLGITKALGRGRQARLALWQIIARVIEQGSRLSAVRLHETHALAQVVGLERGFDENDFYDNLAWLAEHQARIEQRLFKARSASHACSLFLYDVTSTYLEGEHNAFGAYGYNRDKKRGKKQIVIGLLCEADGAPVSVEVFKGNTQDPQTVAPQIRKSVERFGCTHVVFVGDRGMIKRAQMNELNVAGFCYITALTKPQIDKLLNEGALQMELFDEALCEVEHEGRRLVLRRNPVRAQELAATRQDKCATLKAFVAEQNAYLAQHPRARVETALKRVRQKSDTLKVAAWLRVHAVGRTLRLEVDETACRQAARLDGCYVLVTDVPVHAATTETIHERYKALTHVERGFRVSKTGHLELRPVYVRSESSTRGHVFVVMLGYLIRRELERAWAALDFTVEEGLDALKTLCTIHLRLRGGRKVDQIPIPRASSQALLEALEVQLPPFMPHSEIHVATKRKLPSRRATS